MSAPAPAPVPVHDGLFVGDPEPALLGSRCNDCSGHHFPRHRTCPYCASASVEPVTLSRSGILWAHTAVTAAPPGYQGDVPYGFGVVELPEGIRVVTRLTVADPERLNPGQEMHLVVVPLHHSDEGGVVTTFAFAPGET